MWILVGDLCVSGAVLGSNPLYGVSGHNIMNIWRII
nr:MAG TPA: hypothetical protein [Bacteriophage sp.]